MGKVELLIRSIKKRGLANTMRYLSHELTFDWIHNTDTRPEIADYDPERDESESFVGPYLGANPFIVDRCIKRCRQLGVEIHNASFIDIGSGKGRVVLIAALSGFKKVIGVEIDSALCLTAENNLEANKAKTSGEYKLCNCDAANYEYPENLDVVFIYNSFGVRVMRNVLKKITDKYKGHSQGMKFAPLYLIYLNPVYSEVFSEFGLSPLCDVEKEALIYRIR